jgi:UDP-glucose 4-epimerase
VKVSAGDPVFDLEVNGGGTARIATLAADHGARKLIYASSGGTVYGDPCRSQ